MGTVMAWVTIVRYGIVQAAIVAGTVLPITTLPRIMQNELGFLAIVAGGLVGIYYTSQLTRLIAGALSDMAERRTPFIIIGLGLCGASSVLAAHAIGWIAQDAPFAVAFAVLGYVGVGIGIGVAGTTLFALLAASVAPQRRAPAATIVWFIMIASLAGTTVAAGKAMTPFTFERLNEVALIIAVVAFIVGTLGIIGTEPRETTASERAKPKLRDALKTLVEPSTRSFALFIFVSMFAYNMQELILETFLGAQHGLDAGESTSFSGYHKAGVPVGMLVAAVTGRFFQGTRGVLLALTIAGCLGSATALLSLAASSYGAAPGQLVATIALLGFSNGLFAGGALASMFALAGGGVERREGTRMGAFGLAQAFGFGAGMFFGALQLDATRQFLSDASAFASVFVIEAAVFAAASLLAIRISRAPSSVPAQAYPA